jgi:hypothetical protein
MSEPIHEFSNDTWLAFIENELHICCEPSGGYDMVSIHKILKLISEKYPGIYMDYVNVDMLKKYT